MANGFPVVPFAPGVPPLPRSPFETFASVALLVVDTLSGIGLFGGPQWGIFLGGIPVVLADNVVSFEYRQDWSISDYPQEAGAFETYDKVQVPFVARVRFSRGGTIFDRQQLLDSIAAIAGDFNLYDVVTPEEVYTSVNVSHYDYRRTSVQGVGNITVDVWLVQIRVTVSEGLFFGQSASSADPLSGGQTQVGTPTSQQEQAVSESIASTPSAAAADQ